MHRDNFTVTLLMGFQTAKTTCFRRYKDKMTRSR